MLTSSVVTYPKEWQQRYFIKSYSLIDPVMRHASTSSYPFDWEDVSHDEPVIKEMFLDAVRHKVGSNGLSIPVRNRKNSYAIVSFTSDTPRDEWERFKTLNINTLQHVSALIDSAAMTGLKVEEAPEVNLSLREEECLIWAAQKKPMKTSQR